MTVISDSLFEDCVSTTPGSVFNWDSTGSHEITVFTIKKSKFRRCSSSDIAGCLHGIGVSLTLEDDIFDRCHCADKGDILGGNILHVEDSNLTMRCIEAINSWIDTNSGDSTFQTLRGQGQFKYVNESHCSDNYKGGMFDIRDNFDGYTGEFLNLADSKLSYALTNTNPNGTGLSYYNKVNILDCTLTHGLFYRLSGTLRIRNGFFFGNSWLENSGVIDIQDCVGDFELDGVTPLEQTQTVPVEMENCIWESTEKFSKVKIAQKASPYIGFVVIMD